MAMTPAERVKRATEKKAAKFERLEDFARWVIAALPDGEIAARARVALGEVTPAVTIPAAGGHSPHGRGYVSEAAVKLAMSMGVIPTVPNMAQDLSKPAMQPNFRPGKTAKGGK